MRSLLKCSQCGAMLPPGKTVCPRDGARAVEDNPFGDESTVRHDSPSRRSQGKAPEAPPNSLALVPDAPEEEDEAEDSPASGGWEATVSRDVMVGKQLGDFVVKRRIGAGGMGIVYEGEHPIIGRKVAIKILRPELSEGSGARDLIAEARAASAVRHRGIIDIFGFGTIPHIGQYLVMEYLEGAPLDEVISQRAPMLEVEVVALLDELLAALGAAHAMGVIHRDLKPGNIFVVRDSGGGESVKVLDFGLAKRSEMPNGTSPQTRASMIVGTPEYMAPEQATGQAVGPHTDIYSVGVIAFEMLTRRLPFEGPSAMSIAIQHVQAKPPAPSTYVDIHPALDELVLRLLAKTTAQRPTTVDAVRRELKAIARQLGDGATRLEPSPRGEKPSEPVPPVRTQPLPVQAANRPVPRNSRPAPELATETLAETPAVELPESVTVRRADPTVAPGAHPTTERVASVRPSRTPQLAVVGVLALLLLGGLGFWFLRPGETPLPVPPTVVEPPPTVVKAEPITPTPTPPPVEVKTVTPPPEETPKPPPVEISAGKVAQQTPNTSQTVQKKPGSRPGTSADQYFPLEVQVSPGWGVLRIKSGPWADMFVDRQQRGQVPQDNNLELKAGTYQLELRNPKFKEYRATVRILSGKRTEHQVNWEKATEGP
ncbi:serine/threonine-protein kinase [Hyalangium rubrum]|uniref:Protein kinase n=1 Tax=Hyalangium rubrum TaxID=3103134 RepID=A0ABU5HBD5_9BACT|nr:protein kinase [Hyalangium sp. s54d21]MDY7230437.1 protein kinase [Hyalangium sp. s54d21]